MLILSLFVVAFLAMNALAAKSPVEERKIDPRAYKMTQFAFPGEINLLSYPDESIGQAGTHDADAVRQALGSQRSSRATGSLVGVTWYDYQHNGSMGRQIETQTVLDGAAAGDTYVHMNFMYMPGRAFESRAYYYNSYDLTGKDWGGSDIPQPDDDYGGYVSICATNDGRGIVGGHNKAADGLYDPHYWFDYSPLMAYWGFDHQVPKALQNAGAAPEHIPQDVIWPKARFIETATDTFLHIIAQVSMADAADPQAIYYFRRSGHEDNAGAIWEGTLIDTIYDISQDIAAAEGGGKIALVWTANLPCEGLTGSAPSGDEIDCGSTYNRFVQWDNDIWYAISNDNGSSFFTAGNNNSDIMAVAFNVTKYADGELDEDEYRPYTDANALIDGAGNLHIVWGGSFWPTTAYSNNDVGYYANRIFHWSENQPYIRTAHNADWSQTECNFGAWNLNASKMTISECRGKLYVLFTQANDIPAGVENDCADEGNPGFPGGAANGDLYVTISADGGLTWDGARNITNTRTPGCDSAGGTGGPCESDHWPSMSRFGTTVGDIAGDANQVCIFCNGTEAGNYLDLMYINDPSAGGIVQNDGTWQQASVYWARLGCVDEVQEPTLDMSPNGIGWPAWTKHGIALFVPLKLENNGNANLDFDIAEFEGTAAPSDVPWLTYLPFSSDVLESGLNNTRNYTVEINESGYIDDPGTAVRLLGGLIFTSNAATNPDTFHIDVVVADTVYPPEVDTISTSCLSLVCVNNASFGNQGDNRVNMDYVDNGDCDTNATVYLYDGSPVLGWVRGADTTMNWSVFGNSYVDTIGFVQISNTDTYMEGNYEAYTATVVNNDSSMVIEKTWYAPQDVEDCNFIVQRIKLYDNGDKDGANDHTNLIFGEVIDWDIPSDTASRNGSAFNEDLMAIWQYGGYYEDTSSTVYPCAPLRNDSRYGGMDFLTMYKWDGTDNTIVTDNEGRPFHNAYTIDNSTFVYGNDNGFDVTELCSLMVTNTGFSTYSSTEPESTYTDLHMTMTFVDDYTLLAGETLIVWVELYTTPIGSSESTVSAIINGSRANFCEDFLPTGFETDPNVCGCCLLRGDVANPKDGAVLVNDIVWLVNYLFKGGTAPDCLDEGDCATPLDGTILVNDIVFLVNYLFKGGATPPPC